MADLNGDGRPEAAISLLAAGPTRGVGGPGFGFPVLRWNGKAYVQHRWEHEDKPCSPP